MNNIINELKTQYGSYPFTTQFVIQEHYATSFHFDLRIQKGNVAPSWAIPKAKLPKEKEKILAVRTEDHPLEWMTYSGIIPHGYGKGKVNIYDKGTCIVYVWRDSYIAFQLIGEKVKGYYNLLRMKKDQWLLIKIDDEKAKNKFEKSNDLEEHEIQYKTKLMFFKESQPYKILKNKNNITEFYLDIDDEAQIKENIEKYLDCKSYNMVLSEEETEQIIVGEDIFSSSISTYHIFLKEEKLKEGFEWTNKDMK